MLSNEYHNSSMVFGHFPPHHHQTNPIVNYNPATTTTAAAFNGGLYNPSFYPPLYDSFSRTNSSLSSNSNRSWSGVDGIGGGSVGGIGGGAWSNSSAFLQAYDDDNDMVAVVSKFGRTNLTSGPGGNPASVYNVNGANGRDPTEFLSSPAGFEASDGVQNLEQYLRRRPKFFVGGGEGGGEGEMTDEDDGQAGGREERRSSQASSNGASDGAEGSPKMDEDEEEKGEKKLELGVDDNSMEVQNNQRPEENDRMTRARRGDGEVSTGFFAGPEDRMVKNNGGGFMGGAKIDINSNLVDDKTRRGTERTGVEEEVRNKGYDYFAQYKPQYININNDTGRDGERDLGREIDERRQQEDVYAMGLIDYRGGMGPPTAAIFSPIQQHAAIMGGGRGGGGGEGNMIGGYAIPTEVVNKEEIYASFHPYHHHHQNPFHPDFHHQHQHQQNQLGMRQQQDLNVNDKYGMAANVADQTPTLFAAAAADPPYPQIAANPHGITQSGHNKYTNDQLEVEDGRPPQNSCRPRKGSFESTLTTTPKTTSGVATKKRRKYQRVNPEAVKDDSKYWTRRRKNTEAVRRARAKQRNKKLQLEMKLEALGSENVQLEHELFSTIHTLPPP